MRSTGVSGLVHRHLFVDRISPQTRKTATSLTTFQTTINKHQHRYCNRYSSSLKEYYHSSSFGNILGVKICLYFCLYAPICLYGNIPDWRFMASNSIICLYLGRLIRIKQLKHNVKTILQRRGILSLKSYTTYWLPAIQAIKTCLYGWCFIISDGIICLYNLVISGLYVYIVL